MGLPDAFPTPGLVPTSGDRALERAGHHLNPEEEARTGAQASACVPELTPFRKAVYATGDLTLNAGLSALSLVYTTYFLVQIGGLRPALAGMIPLLARGIDAFFDPLMGCVSDRTRGRAGRRRPWFLLGAVPYGLFFASLWVDPPFTGTAERFLCSTRSGTTRARSRRPPYSRPSAG